MVRACLRSESRPAEKQSATMSTVSNLYQSSPEFQRNTLPFHGMAIGWHMRLSQTAPCGGVKPTEAIDCSLRRHQAVPTSCIHAGRRMELKSSTSRWRGDDCPECTASRPAAANPKSCSQSWNKSNRKRNGRRMARGSALAEPRALQLLYPVQTSTFLILLPKR